MLGLPRACVLVSLSARALGMCPFFLAVIRFRV